MTKNLSALTESAVPPAPDPLWVGQLAQLDPRAHGNLIGFLEIFQTGGRVPERLMHLIWIGVDLVVTHLHEIGVNNHVLGALESGGTVAEIIEVMEIASTVIDVSLATAYPIIFEEAEAAGIATPDRRRPLTKDEETLSAQLVAKLGFRPAWLDLALRASPKFVRNYVALSHATGTTGALDPKSRAFIFLAIYSSPALNRPEQIREHSRRAIELGATTEELLDIVQLASGIGVHAMMTGVPPLANAKGL